MCIVLLPPGANPIVVNEISYRIVSYRIVSYRIVSYRIVSYHIVSYHIISYHIISYRIISYRIISYRISYRIISYHIIYVPEFCAILGYYRAHSGNSSPVFRDSWPLKMWSIGRPETSLRNYRYVLRNDSEEHRSCLLGGESLKSQKDFPVCRIFSHPSALNDVWSSREYSRLWLHAHRSRGRVGWVRSVALQRTGCDGSVHPRPGCWVWAATCKTEKMASQSHGSYRAVKLVGTRFMPVFPKQPRLCGFATVYIPDFFEP
jgi:hypothetical protein